MPLAADNWYEASRSAGVTGTTVDVSAIPGFTAGLFGIIVESDGVSIVVERSRYSTIDGVQWAAGATAGAINITPSTPTP
jgi:hypothetical protein